MRTFLCLSALFLLIFPEICLSEATGTPKETELRGFCYKCPKNERPIDCTEVMKNGVTESGVRTVYPRSRLADGKHIDVYCDMETNGGGWTVIQRRSYVNPTDYYLKDVQEYKKGYGDLKKAFWLGNDKIYYISNQGQYALRMDVTQDNGIYGYVRYENFWTEAKEAEYELHMSEESGKAGDSLSIDKGRDSYTKGQPNQPNVSGPEWIRLSGQRLTYVMTTILSGQNVLLEKKVYPRNVTNPWSFEDFRNALITTEIKLRPKKYKMSGNSY